MQQTNTLLPNILYATPFSFYQNDLGHSSHRGAKKTIKTYLFQPFSYLRLPFQLCLHQFLLLACQLYLILYPFLFLYFLQ